MISKAGISDGLYDGILQKQNLLHKKIKYLTSLLIMEWE